MPYKSKKLTDISWYGSYHITGTTAGIVNFKFKDFEAAVEDLSSCVKLDKNNSSAYTYLASSQT